MPPMNKITNILLAFVLVAAQVNTAKAAESTIKAQTNNLNYVTDVSLSADTADAIVAKGLELSTVTPAPTPAVPQEEVIDTSTPEGLKAYAEKVITESFGKGQFAAFDFIVTHESNWNLNAVNPTSGAYGLGQALPASKIKDRSAKGQIEWMKGYIETRYGTPKAAKAAWIGHGGWY